MRHTARVAAIAMTVAAAATTGGCVVFSTALPLTSEAHAPVAEQTVRVLAGGLPASTYALVALVLVDTTDADDALLQLRRKAAAVGADAVIRTRLTTHGYQVVLSGLAVRVLPPPPVGAGTRPERTSP